MSFLPLDLRQDHHVHSIFSDGIGTLAQNAAVAFQAGLSHLGCVDHVRRDTLYLPQFVDAVRTEREHALVTMSIGIETKILDIQGTLDLPDLPDGIERIYVADHQFPTLEGPISPRAVRAKLETRTWSAADAIGMLIEATNAAMRNEQRIPVTLAHLFSILPKIGLHEEMVSDTHLVSLAATAAITKTTLEVSERWRCPSLRVIQHFQAAGVPLVCSTDAHTPDAIGQYQYVASIAGALNADTIA